MNRCWRTVAFCIMTVFPATLSAQDHRSDPKHQKHGSEGSDRHGINAPFLDPDLDVSQWLGRFEVESRDAYAGRRSVLAACDIKPGSVVADVGAGTGFYSRLFADAVGQDGWVFAIDISTRFLEHINHQVVKDKVDNITSVLSTHDSLRLPSNSIDLAFVCDTYHHFEHPQAMLDSIRSALKPGSMMVVVSIDRIPGKSREFVLNHVRAGKATFRQEIVDAGFRFVDEIGIPEFKESYLLRFRKSDESIGH